MFTQADVLHPGLIHDLGLTCDEADSINRQQGLHCARCSSNLRSCALAKPFMSFFAHVGTLESFVKKESQPNITLLELNEAGSLTAYLRQLPNYTFGSYPSVDMMALPYPDNTFDAVIHSDSLEHIADPLLALSECFRVLKPQGACLYTIPVIVGRLTRRRAGLPKSHHGNYEAAQEDYIVHTEFGADFWTLPVKAGFSHTGIDVYLPKVDGPMHSDCFRLHFLEASHDGAF